MRPRPPPSSSGSPASPWSMGARGGAGEGPAAGARAAPPGAGAPAPLVERLRVVHLKMVDAVLSGEGLGRVAELAAEAAGSPVAIVIPRLGPAALSPGVQADVGALRRYV